MWRSLALAFVLMVSLLAAPARPQVPLSQPGVANPAPSAAPAINTGVPSPDGERPAAPLVWGVAILCTLIILFIVCMPSRKG